MTGRVEMIAEKGPGPVRAAADLRAVRGRSAGASVALVDWISQRLGRVGRRGFFLGAAVAGSALATDPKAYALRPQTAYATICGPGNTAASGWTVFCATLNRGANTCPPGSFAAGWWKAAGSSWCGGGYRYIVDCNAACTKCSSGCSDHICDANCWNCRCGVGSTATCDQRRVCCNAFRYGQCNTHVGCSGGVHCRIVSCVPPYLWANCSTTSLREDATAEHSTPYLPQWGPHELRYRDLGAQRSFLGASLGPIRKISDGRGSYVEYERGSIWHTSTTGAKALPTFVASVWRNAGGASLIGYPTSELTRGPRDGFWITTFERGCITDSSVTSTQIVKGAAWTAWRAAGRESGILRYPTGPFMAAGSGWTQSFQGGVLAGASTAVGYPVYGVAFNLWTSLGGTTGSLGFPTATPSSSAAGWVQGFERGAILDSTATPMTAVDGVMWTAYARGGRQTGPLGFPLTPGSATPRGRRQDFQGGQLWALGTDAAYAVRGAVLDAWLRDGGATGTYGYPLSDTTAAGAHLTCTFEGGTITA